MALLRANSHVAGGLVIVALAGAGAVASVIVRAVDPRAVVIRGSLVLIVGVGLTLLAVAAGSPVGFFAGSAIAGLGFRPAFSAVYRSLAPLAPPDRRGALLAAIYVVIYFSFSVPAIVAGGAVSVFGLRGTTYAYGLGVMALAAVTTVAVSCRLAAGEAAA